MSNIINNEIVKYINEKFSSVELNTNQKAEILAQYLDSTKPLEEIKKSIDERYDELVNITNNTNNTDSVNKISSYTGIDLYVKDTNTDTINVVVDMKDIDELRSQLKTTSYYDLNKDSLSFSKDGNDYGLILKVDDNTNINISPILFSKDKTTLYTWNSNDNTFTIMSSNIDKKDSYLNNFDGKKNTNNDITFNVDKVRHISEMNSVDHDEMIKNSIVKYSYVAKEKNDVDISDEKINKAIERLQDKNYNEVDSLLKSSLSKTHNKLKQLGFTDAMSLGIFCIGFGVFICLMALIILI